MSPPPDIREPSEPDRQQIVLFAKRFREAWSACGDSQDAVSLSNYLPASDEPHYEYVLAELIPIDLKHQWQRGEKVYLESYLELFPTNSQKEQFPTELIYQEFSIRQQHEPVELIDYQKRFPKQFGDLEQLVQQSGDYQGTLRPLDYDDPSERLTKTTRPVDATQELEASDGPPAVPLNIRPSTWKVSEAYQKVQVIGRGQFGEVWLGEAPGGVEVALKIVPLGGGRRISDYERRSLELMKRVRHPSLLQIHAYAEDDRELWIVMELADQSLEERFEECLLTDEQRIPQEELMRYMTQSAEALDYLHQQNILHRDVKPANVLLFKNHARVGDFGLARVLEPEASEITGTVIGTPLYMAPEVWDGKVEARSDQYSLAVMYAHLRCGEPPFSGTSMLQIMDDHTKRGPDLSNLPRVERRIVRKALSKNPEGRYETCGEFVQALSRVQPKETAQKKTRADDAGQSGRDLGSVDAAGRRRTHSP